jgi:chromosomal replication initiation ATPase DnaA
VTTARGSLQKLYAGFLLGSVEFIKDKLKDLKIQIASDDVAYKKALRDDLEVAEEIIEEVTSYYKTTIADIKESTGRPMYKKYILVYLLRRLTGLSNREIGRYVGMRPSAVSKAGMAIERQRDKDRRIKPVVRTIVSKFEG